MPTGADEAEGERAEAGAVAKRGAEAGVVMKEAEEVMRRRQVRCRQSPHS